MCPVPWFLEWDLFMWSLVALALVPMMQDAHFQLFHVVAARWTLPASCGCSSTWGHHSCRKVFPLGPGSGPQGHAEQYPLTSPWLAFSREDSRLCPVCLHLPPHMPFRCLHGEKSTQDGAGTQTCWPGHGSTSLQHHLSPHVFYSFQFL